MQRLMLFTVIGIGVLGVAAAGLWLAVRSSVERVVYDVLDDDKALAIEIRSYPPMVVAETHRRGDRDGAIRSAFSPLARYIFARDRGGEKIAMTAPVTQSPVGDAWQVRFVMPAGASLGTLPPPERDDVTLTQLPGSRKAAIRFSGVADDALLSEKERVLRRWMAANDLRGETVTYAFYDDPVTPGFLRRNEVLIDLEPSAP